MMKSSPKQILIDTHIFVWSLLDPKRLSEEAGHLLNNNITEIWLSSISAWEIMLLVDKKRLTLEEPADSWIRKGLALASIQEAAITTEIAILSRQLELPHQDPADRFIAATAAVYDMPLISADENLQACPALRVIA